VFTTGGFATPTLRGDAAIVDVRYGPKGIAAQAGLTPMRSSRRFGTAILIRFRSLDDRDSSRHEPERRDGDLHWAATSGPAANRAKQAQGYILAGPAVDTWSRFEGQGAPVDALMAALDAGQAAGGDTRGMQAASMVIVKKGGGVWLNNDTVLRFQVDDSPDPFKELRRVVESWNAARAKNGQRPVRPQ
jgi:hypothetical protein